MTFNKFIAKLEKSMKMELPGRDTQMLMSPSDRGERFRNFEEKENAKQSAVLILLYPKNGETYTVFIKRNTYNGHHSGQIAMPGGKTEAEDKNNTDTALREANEEVGINANDVKIVGELTKLYIPVSNINVYPIVGYLDYEPKFIANADEVEEIIPFKIDQLISKEIVKTEVLHIKDFTIDAPYFNLNGHHMWGASAMIVSEFVEIIKSNL